MEINEKIVRTASSFMGQEEIRGNLGFKDEQFQQMMEAVGWERTQAWCAYFCELVWKLAFVHDKQIVKELDKLMNASAVQTWKNFLQSDWETSTNPVPGALAAWQTYKNGEPHWTGHIAIVEALKPTVGFASIEGNAQPIWEKVLTPTGFTEIGQLREGRELIDPFTGETQKVEKIYDQGYRPIYKIELSDGSVCYSADNHLWKVLSSNHKGYYIEDTLHLEKRFNSKKKESLYFPPMKKFDFIGSNYIIPPYSMGVLIGDGGLTQGIKFTTKDKEIISILEKEMWYANIKKIPKTLYDYHIKETATNKPYLTEINDLGLRVTSKNKFIPLKYLYGTYDDRLSLLQGILDTDGHIDKYGRIEFTTVSERLIEDVVWLVRSLGGKAKIQIKERLQYTSPTQSTIKVLNHNAYRIAIIFNNNYIDLFRLSRKKKLQKFSKKNKSRYIKSIMYIGIEKCRCIKVSNPHGLYVTSDFIVTHNTNDQGGREGYTVASKIRAINFERDNGLRLLGFIHPVKKNS